MLVQSYVVEDDQFLYHSCPHQNGCPLKKILVINFHELSELRDAENFCLTVDFHIPRVCY